MFWGLVGVSLDEVGELVALRSLWIPQLVVKWGASDQGLINVVDGFGSVGFFNQGLG